jgi:hypothetical protein
MFRYEKNSAHMSRVIRHREEIRNQGKPYTTQINK